MSATRCFSQTHTRFNSYKFAGSLPEVDLSIAFDLRLSPICVLPCVGQDFPSVQSLAGCWHIALHIGDNAQGSAGIVFGENVEPSLSDRRLSCEQNTSDDYTPVLEAIEVADFKVLSCHAGHSSNQAADQHLGN